jgi:FkbM family methyltransferase
MPDQRASSLEDRSGAHRFVLPIFLERVEHMDRRSFITGAVTGVAGTGLLGSGLLAISPSLRVAGRDAAGRGTVSYSQMGEDLVLFHLLKDAMKISRPTYLDIGAADPIAGNNTYLLHWADGHGVLVEPNPLYQEALKMHRPHDIVVQAGIGVSDAKEADYYVFKDAPMLNTFSPDDVEWRRKKAGHEVIEKVLKMPLITINELIEKYLGKAPDLLSIDIEQMDLPVLRTLDFSKYRPAVIIAESSPTGRIPDFLQSQGYELRAASMYNVIFADPKRYVATAP